MKTYYLIITLLLSLAVKAQIVNIPDNAFKAKLLQASPTLNIARNQAGLKIKIDTNSDGQIQVTEALDVYYLSFSGANVNSLTGIEAFTNLIDLNCRNNNLSVLDCSMLTNLEILNCEYNDLVSINISGLSSLFSLDCSNNNLTAIDFPAMSALHDIDCSHNLITSLDLSGLPMLTSLSVNNNQLTGIDLAGHPLLVEVDCSVNSMVSIDLSNVASLTHLNCSSNQLTSLDATLLPELYSLNCSENALTNLNVTNLPVLRRIECDHNQLSAITISGLPGLQHLDCSYNLLTALNLTEPLTLSILDCSHNQINTLNMGTNTFDYAALDFSYNQLTSLDASTFMPFDIICNNNLLTSFIFPVNPPSMENIDCSHNLLTSIASSIDVWNFDCSFNQLTSIASDVDVWEFDCSFNQLTSLSLTGNIDELDCRNNQLTDISLPGSMDALHCQENLFQSLHLENTVFNTLRCGSNPHLQSLFVKNGNIGEEIWFENTPSLQYICADAGQIGNLNPIEPQDTTNIEVNSYCSFTPGAFYDIIGQQQYDMDNNGCGATDPMFPNLRFSITDGVVQGDIICDVSGNYAIPVQAGSHTITPVLGPYFAATPSSATVTFPASMSPATQNFCIIPNGEHPDVEISLFNLDIAVPGFDASYRIVYKNKGTTTASGAVSFSFDDNTLDFMSANPVTDNQSAGLLSWDYTNLQPFESRSIDFTLNLNSPVETPPLNQDDVLQFTAAIGLSADEGPSDNIAALQQTVFNAFDPNDKTCLEGDTITPETVGEYVHYKIRFENTGNYPAAIVTVKDVIDTSKFDINTLTPITASHPFITRITNTNQVEFIFDNIGLPFDDANNDGYVVFKIKTRPTLVLGDQLSNTAGIYFNYNAPVITNTAVTTVAIPLGIDDNDNNFGFTLYPNPTKNTLSISSKINASINEILIYNTLGQQVMKVLPVAGDNSIDVSRLAEGSYVVKVTSAKTSWSSPFIKE